MTMKALRATAVAFLLLPFHSSAWSVEDKFHVTEAEKAACGPDLVSLCGNIGEDQDKLLACMKGKRADLSAGCRTVFDKGLLRRGMR